MDPARWEKLQTLFTQALALEAHQRAAFVAQVCGPDEALRKELTQLLDSSEQAPAFFTQLAETFLPDAEGQPDPYGLINSQLAAYQILDVLGQGGMGVVYLAQDMRLARAVAIKLLLPHSNQNTRARQRFRHEAQTASQLEHPNVCTILEVNETPEGYPYMVMPFYEGITLKARLAEGPLPIDQVLALGVQVAAGLEAAHAAGIVHRDVNPANVLITPEGTAILLDFGLAQTTASHLTQTGAALGTVAYMSPEQARSRPLDPRTDLWSFGVMLYEMLAGTRPFQGAHQQAIFYAILHQVPVPLAERRPAVPPALAQVVMRCLQKPAVARYPSATLLKAALAQVPHAPVQPVRTVRRRGRVSSALMMAALVVAGFLLTNWNAWLGLPGLPVVKHLAIIPMPSAQANADALQYARGLAATLTQNLSLLEQFGQAFQVVPFEEVEEVDLLNPHLSLGVNLLVNLYVTQAGAAFNVGLEVRDAATRQILRHAEVKLNGTAPEVPSALTFILAELLQLDTPASGRALIEAGATTVPGAFDFYSQGRGYLEGDGTPENLEAALALFQQALAIDSTYALALAGLGQAYWRKYNATQDVQWATVAERYCERALERNDRLVSVYITLGLIHTGTDRPGTGIAAFNMALARDSLSAAAYRGLAKAYQVVGRLQDVEQTYKHAIRLRPDHWAGYHQLGKYYSAQARYSEANAQFQHAVDLAPGNIRAYRSLAGSYYFLGEYETAIKLYQKALQLGPDYASYSNLASIYYYQGRYEQATETYEQALATKDTHYLLWQNLATAYEQVPHLTQKALPAYVKAATLAEKKLALDTRNEALMSHLASIYAALGKAAQSKALLGRLAAVTGKQAASMNYMASSYERLGDRLNALYWSEQAFAEGYPVTEFMRDPNMQGLRKDPRFQAMIKTYTRSR